MYINISEYQYETIMEALDAYQYRMKSVIDDPWGQPSRKEAAAFAYKAALCAQFELDESWSIAQQEEQMAQADSIPF
jgi:hypothetical protein